jgi:predicted dehydrogenase
MMKETVWVSVYGIAVIGCGAISKEHLDYVSTSSLAELVGVCDLSPAASEYTAQRFGASKAYTDHRLMLAEARADVVHILTPPMSHGFLVREALHADAHVICEKPLALTADSLAELQQLAASKNRVLMETQNVRFNDQILTIEQLIRDNKLGNVVNVDVSISVDIAGPGGKFSDLNVAAPGKELPGGAIHDFLPHMAYLALHFFQYPTVERASSLWRNISGNPQVVYDEMDSIIELSGGVTASARFRSRVKPDRFRVTVNGTAGSVETDIYQPYIRAELRRAGPQLSPLVNHAANGASLLKSSVSNFRSKVLQHSPYHGMPRMLEGLYRSILDGSPPPISPQEMHRSALLIDALIEGTHS